MSKLFENIKDCPPVEQFVWENMVAVNWGDFGGIKELSLVELAVLQTMIGIQMSEIKERRDASSQDTN